MGSQMTPSMLMKVKTHKCGLLFIVYQTMIVISLAKEVVFGGVGLSVCLSVCGHYSNSYEWIGMKFQGRVLGSTVKN